MKTLSKKLLTACLALMVAVVMAVPAFAADNSNTLIERDYTPYISYEEQRNRFIADAENNGSKSNISAAFGTYAASTGYRKRKTGTHYTLCN